MRGVKSPVTLVTPVTLVSLLWAAASGQQPDATVSSAYMSHQILPCTFRTGDNLLVHWMKEPLQTPVVHSYYHGTDQLDHQFQQFKGRTSMFHDQLSTGNASLLLKKVQISDRGRYKCYTSNSMGRLESFVNLEVEAPVTKVSIVEEGERITCRSEGIYPKPQVTWSRSQSADTTIEETEQELYNIRSSVRSDDKVNFTCHVTNQRSSRSATLTTAGDFTVTGTEETLDCSALKPPLTAITWRFNGSLIVQKDVLLNVTERWRDHMKDLSTSGSLTLERLSPDLSGIYMCEVANEEESHVKVIRVTIAAGTGGEVGAAASPWLGLLALIPLGVVGLLVYCCVTRRPAGLMIVSSFECSGAPLREVRQRGQTNLGDPDIQEVPKQPHWWVSSGDGPSPVDQIFTLRRIKEAERVR